MAPSKKKQVNTKPRRDEEREVKMLGENRLAPSHSACSRRFPHECLTILYPVSENVQDEKKYLSTHYAKIHGNQINSP